MTRYLRRRRPDWEDTFRATALGIGIGVATGVAAFYLARLFLTREVLGDDRGVGGGSGRP